ncbi:MAG: 2,3-bisphosphoglycerate-independent phosphoglycerate mutase [Firmicutes bacterium]|nr:2,3-bisphosphoglycerate-independent phosphoglycerate mutase [Bacillota bacterium]
MYLANRPVILVIMDGWGCRAEKEGNAIAHASIPYLRHLGESCPFTLLGAAGEAVGLPEGQIGNSEVGHLNIGAGRIVYQDLSRINNSIEAGVFFENKIIKQTLETVGRKRSSLHLMGLLSDGGVHSHIDQLFALLIAARRFGMKQNVFVHAILDGRDVPPANALKYIKELDEFCSANAVGRIASIAGRYYAMDRDNRWERTKKAYDAYVYGQGVLARDPFAALDAAYRRGETDEFVAPVSIIQPGGDPIRITSEDAILFFNFRPDRVRQIARAFLEKELEEFDRGPEAVFPLVVTMTEYDKNFDCPVVFPPEYLRDTLGEWLSKSGCKQYRLAETEKYAHVTFFFNGGREEPFPGEERFMVPSPAVATYDLQPEMSAPRVARKACLEIARQKHSFFVVNFANADMVGHTGNMEATIKAVEAVDRGVESIAEQALKSGYWTLVTADHGNADMVQDPVTGKPVTAHTTSAVPFILLGKQNMYNLRSGGVLADIAPTVLELMGMPLPEEMTGRSLLLEKGSISTGKPDGKPGTPGIPM